MRVHIDVLGWLHVAAGTIGLLTAMSLAVLAFGTSIALEARASGDRAASPAVWVLLLGACVLFLVGATTGVVGRAILVRGRFGRPAALALAVPSLVVVPFGTALGVYTLWTLLNDDARREFRPRVESVDERPHGTPGP
jgi:hypothetical protein